MQMKWEVKRPGNWLFHCHLSFHVTSDIRLPNAELFDPDGSHQHMAGLVLGIKVKDGPSELISKGDPKNINMTIPEPIRDEIGLKEGDTIKVSIGDQGTLIIEKIQPK